MNKIIPDFVECIYNTNTYFLKIHTSTFWQYTLPKRLMHFSGKRLNRTIHKNYLAQYYY